jgi:antitoxin VapB
MTYTAKLFEIEGDQAFDLPDELRFDSDEVYIYRDAATGGVILTPKPNPSSTAQISADLLTR